MVEQEKRYGLLMIQRELGTGWGEGLPTHGEREPPEGATGRESLQREPRGERASSLLETIYMNVLTYSVCSIWGCGV